MTTGFQAMVTNDENGRVQVKSEAKKSHNDREKLEKRKLHKKTLYHDASKALEISK